MKDGDGMTVYADTTAMVELVCDGANSDLLGRLWSAAGRVVAAATLRPETRSCLRVRRADGLIDARTEARAAARLDELIADVEQVAVDGELAARATELGERHSLDSDAAVHLAAAVATDAPRVVVATLDPGLGVAAVAAGLATVPQTRIPVPA